jgi:hypothetical protein
MSSKDWKPWWERAADIHNPQERQEFIRAVGGATKPTSTFGHDLLLSIIAGYVGGKVAQRTGNKK